MGFGWHLDCLAWWLFWYFSHTPFDSDISELNFFHKKWKYYFLLFMLYNFLKPFKKPILFTLYLVLLVSGYFLWRTFTDTGIMFWNYGNIYTYTDISFSAMIIILFPLFVIGVIYKWLLFWRKETLDMKTAIGTGWWLIGTIISGASCCGSTLALSFGLLPLMNILPYNGIELKVLGLLWLLWAIVHLYKNLETCQLKK